MRDYLNNIFETILSVSQALKITLSKYFQPEVTISYPEERDLLPERSRMRLYNDVDNCISCSLCAISCPVQCIYIQSVPKKEDEPILKTTNGMPIKQTLTQFVIDTTLCCYCGICSAVCPTDCLNHTTDYEFSQFTLEPFKYNYLDPEIKKWKKRLYG